MLVKNTLNKAVMAHIFPYMVLCKTHALLLHFFKEWSLNTKMLSSNHTHLLTVVHTINLVHRCQLFPCETASVCLDPAAPHFLLDPDTGLHLHWNIITLTWLIVKSAEANWGSTALWRLLFFGLFVFFMFHTKSIGTQEKKTLFFHS